MSIRHGQRPQAKAENYCAHCHVLEAVANPNFHGTSFCSRRCEMGGKAMPTVRPPMCATGDNKPCYWDGKRSQYSLYCSVPCRNAGSSARPQARRFSGNTANMANMADMGRPICQQCRINDAHRNSTLCPACYNALCQGCHQQPPHRNSPYCHGCFEALVASYAQQNYSYRDGDGQGFSATQESAFSPGQRYPQTEPAPQSLCQRCNARPRYVNQRSGVMSAFCSRTCLNNDSSSQICRQCNQGQVWVDQYGNRSQFCSKRCFQAAGAGGASRGGNNNGGSGFFFGVDPFDALIVATQIAAPILSNFHPSLGVIPQAILAKMQSLNKKA